MLDPLISGYHLSAFQVLNTKKEPCELPQPQLFTLSLPPPKNPAKGPFASLLSQLQPYGEATWFPKENKT